MEVEDEGGDVKMDDGGLMILEEVSEDEARWIDECENKEMSRLLSMVTEDKMVKRNILDVSDDISSRLVGSSSKIGKQVKWNDDIMAMDKKVREEVRPLVAEVYSPPRVNKIVKEMGKIPGMSLDLSVSDVDGLP